MTTTIRYTLEQFNIIMFDGIQLELPKETIELITSIANQVGATDYIRTPQFPKLVQITGATSDTSSSSIDVNTLITS